MPTAELHPTEPDRIILESDFRDKDGIKAIPGSRWRDGVWTVPLAWTSCLALRGIFKERLTVGPGLAQWAWELRKTLLDPALALRPQLQLEEGTNPAVEAALALVEARLAARGLKLLEFQRPGVSMGATIKRWLLGDPMGTGKTVQTIVALQVLHQLGVPVLPTLIICPNSMKLTWSKELAKWWVIDDVDPLVIGGGVANKRKLFAAVTDRSAVIINWEAVRLHSRLAHYGSVELARCTLHHGGSELVTSSRCEVCERELNGINFKSVVADEAHRMVDPKAKQSRALKAAAGDAEVRFALTGTPLANAPDDLWSILNFLMPDEYAGKSKYIDRFCEQSWNPFGALNVVGLHAATRDEFFAGFDPHFRRVAKELALPFLPPKVRETRYAEMTPKQAKAYREMYEGMLAEVDEGENAVIATNNLTKNTRLLQFSSAMCSIDEANEVQLTKPSNKINELMAILGDMDPADSVVVAAESRKLIELAAEELEANKISYTLIVGGMSDASRELSKESFQAGHVRVLLMTMKAGGVGLTLTRANTMVFLQRSWSMIDNKQAEDRVHRIGSEVHEKVVIIDIVAPDTVEEKQIADVQEKMDRLEQITRDREALLAAGADVAALDAEAELIVNSSLAPRP